MIDKPGVYTIPAAEYHADPCPDPSLSNSIAKVLLNNSPWHAQTEHRRLNPEHEEEEAERFDLGAAAHAYLLEGETGFVIVEADDWRKKDAQAARADARLAGKTPLLARQWVDVQAMAAAAHQQLAVHEDRPRPFTGGKAEQSLIWQEKGGIWCRARLDWLHDDHLVIDDYKTTEGSAEPDGWIRRQLFGMGYDLQAAFYLRGLRAVFGLDQADGAFRFVVQENFKPFALVVVGLGPEALDSASREIERAIGIWRTCLTTGTFPGYPTRTCWADLPPWEETRRAERAAAHFTPPPAADDGRDVSDQLMETRQ